MNNLINLTQYLADLEYLVNIDSGSNDCPDGLNKCADFFEERFRVLGWQIHRYDLGDHTGNCLVCANREAAHYDVLLIGHLDTVFPVGTAAARPFRYDAEKQLAYGPGVCDMKHGSLLMYYLMKELAPEVNEKLNILCIFNPDEEIGSRHSGEVLEKYAAMTDYIYVYEAGSGDGARCVERKGSTGFTVNFKGKAGHCGYVFSNGAKSAVSEMAKWIVRLDEFQSRERNTTVNVGTASGGIATNVVAEDASLSVSIRYSIDETAAIDAMLEELKAGAAERGIGIDIPAVKRSQPLIPSEKGWEYIRHVAELTAANGIRFSTRARGGLSDANRMAKFGAICLDGMGPAGGSDHSDREYMNVDTVKEAYDLSMLLLTDLCDGK